MQRLTFRDVLPLYCERHGLDAQALAGMLGCSVQDLARLESCYVPDDWHPSFWDLAECISEVVPCDMHAVTRLARAVRREK